MKEKLKDIAISFEVIEPRNYDEFKKRFPVVFDELENPDHIVGNQGLRSLSVDFRRLRKALGLTGHKRGLFTEWMTRFLDENWNWWDLHGGTTKHYAEDENFSYNGRKWILISRRWREVKNPNEEKP